MSTPPTPPPAIGMAIAMLAELQRMEMEMQQLREAILQKVGAAMWLLRENSGISLRELARRIGCSAPFLSDMERGRRRYSVEWIRKANEAMSHNPTPPQAHERKHRQH